MHLEQQVECRFLIDYHGTLKNPIIGQVHRAKNQLSDEDGAALLDPQTYSYIEGKFLRVFRGLPTRTGLLPGVRSWPETRECFSTVLRYKTRQDQERALVEIAKRDDTKLTIVSAMDARNADWVCYGLGEKVMECLDPDNQMILREDWNLGLFKQIAIGYMVRKQDLLPEERDRLLRKVILIDDDINIARIAAYAFGIQSFVPVTEKQAKKYPKLEVPATLIPKGSEAVAKIEAIEALVHMGQGLPEAFELLVAGKL